FIRNKGHLLVVPTGPLTAVPFHLLVTERPVAAPPAGSRITEETAGSFRKASWLIKRQAVSVLPAVSSLQSLRASSRQADSGQPMIGFGDPVFNPARPSEGAKRGSRAARGKARSYSDDSRGARRDR